MSESQSKSLRSFEVKICQVQRAKRWKPSKRFKGKVSRYRRSSVAVRVGHKVYMPGESCGETMEEGLALMSIDISANVWRVESWSGHRIDLRGGVLFEDKMLCITNDMRIATYDFVIDEWSNYPTSGMTPPWRRKFHF